MTDLGDILLALDDPARLTGAAFPEPWMARLFGLTLALSERGLFTLQEFQSALIDAVADFERSGAIADEETYYTRWLQALAALLQGRGLTPTADVAIAERAIVAEAASRKEHQHQVSRDAEGNLRIAPIVVA